ncbi:MAG: hypothetical protein J2P55_09345 [Rhizobiales bacterium]|nr:hypothetical protein [Hyphomicrobiales bacterium]
MVSVTPEGKHCCEVRVIAAFLEANEISGMAIERMVRAVKHPGFVATSEQEPRCHVSSCWRVLLSSAGEEQNAWTRRG